jgi:hypothetical protein
MDFNLMVLMGSLWLSWIHHFESFTVAIMNWLTVTEYMCHKLLWICFVSRNHNPIISLFVTYHCVCNNGNTTDAICEAGTAYHSRAHEFTPLVGSCCSIFIFLYNVLCVIVCHFSFCHCIVCPSIRGFWLPLWYLQNFLVVFYICHNRMYFLSYGLSWWYGRWIYNYLCN